MPLSWLAPVSRYLSSEPPFRPDHEIRLHLGDRRGWIRPAVADTLANLYPAQFHCHDGAAWWQLAGSDYASRSQELQAALEQLRQLGLVPGWRNEAMVLREAGGEPWAALERAAFRTLGLPTTSAHLNAMVQTPAGARMWVATRSASKAVDPGCLDNLVGGGVTGLESVATALGREAQEEAGLWLRHPAARARLHVLRRTGHGVQDEHVHVHEVWLHRDFVPVNHDGEVASTDCLPLPEVLAAICDGRFTRDAALVILYGLQRQYFFGGESAAIGGLLRQHGILG